MTATQTHDHDNMPEEIDFSNAERGKFYKPNARLHLPVYLDDDVRDYLADKAKTKGIEVNDMVNDLLRKDIALIECLK